ncbi:Uncharacterised protein [Mycobacteroides abscessus]|nr:Uncharacterised protein [Mycobacteroides abscessus]CPW10936.1 Uncharacterised protein [Mycobacteroides abscessus]CQA08171.1 Uncharacterised protein [Mycobacteroides abscessus]
MKYESADIAAEQELKSGIANSIISRKQCFRSGAALRSSR